MTVYVDEFRRWAPTRLRCFQAGSSHMLADTLEELHAMAEEIGLKRAWFQAHPLHPHYVDSLFCYLTSAVKRAAQHIVDAFGRLVNGFRRVAQAMETASEWAMRRFSAALLSALVEWDALDVIDQELDTILQVEQTPEFAAVAKRIAAKRAEAIPPETALEGDEVPA